MKSTVLVPIWFVFAALFFISCKENIDERAAREARELTEKCPGPFVNCSRVDSAAYDLPTRTYTYYLTFAEALDSTEYLSQNRAELENGFRQLVVNSVEMQPFVKAGIKFRYVIHSYSQPEKVIYETEVKV